MEIKAISCPHGEKIEAIGSFKETALQMHPLFSCLPVFQHLNFEFKVN